MEKEYAQELIDSIDTSVIEMSAEENISNLIAKTKNDKYGLSL